MSNEVLHLFAITAIVPRGGVHQIGDHDVRMAIDHLHATTMSEWKDDATYAITLSMISSILKGPKGDVIVIAAYTKMPTYLAEQYAEGLCRLLKTTVTHSWWWDEGHIKPGVVRYHCGPDGVPWRE